MLRKLLAFCALVVFGFIGLFAIGMALSSQTDEHYVADQPRVSVESNASSSETSGHDDHTLHTGPDLSASGALSDGRTYGVELIDDAKNSIPTGTELIAQGIIYGENWSTSNECTWLLEGRTRVLQHGEIDPARYCLFLVLLTENGANSRSAWPNIGLECQVTPKKMRDVMHLYHYGDEVQVHGTYAASLDFGIASPPGIRIGIPVLEGCTVADPTSEVVRPKVEEVRRPPPPIEDQSYSY